jgi:hypothetical protein
VTSSRRGVALEKKRLRAFEDRLSGRKGIVKARAAPMSSMINGEKGRGMEKLVGLFLSDLVHFISNLLVNTITWTLGCR